MELESEESEHFHFLLTLVKTRLQWSEVGGEGQTKYNVHSHTL